MIQEIKFENLGHILQEINKLEDKVPDKRTKEFLAYKEDLNYLYALYNEEAGWKVFKLL